MHYQALLVGNFLKAATFGNGDMPTQPTFTIRNVSLEKLESISLKDMDGEAAKMKTKGILYFGETELGLVLNRTNAECLAAMFGPETNEWTGKRVTLYAANVRVGPKTDLGIRILGSPDLDREITVQVKLPRRKPTPMKLVPTGAKPRKAVADAGPTPDPTAAEAALRAASDKGMAALTEAWNALPSPVRAPLKGLRDSELIARAKAVDAVAAVTDDDMGPAVDLS